MGGEFIELANRYNIYLNHQNTKKINSGVSK